MSGLIFKSKMENEQYEKWLGRLKDALENTNVNKSLLMKNNVRCSLISQSACHIWTIKKTTLLMVSDKIKIRNRHYSLTNQFIGVIRILKAGGGPSH